MIILALKVLLSFGPFICGAQDHCPAVQQLPPMDIRGVRLILELALSRATTVLRKEVNHDKPRSIDDACKEHGK